MDLNYNNHLFFKKINDNEKGGIIGKLQVCGLYKPSKTFLNLTVVINFNKLKLILNENYKTYNESYNIKNT